MVPESIPGQLRYQAVVLMRVLAIVGENKVRGECLLQLFEDRLHVRPNKGHEPVWKFLHYCPLQAGGAGKKYSCALRLTLSDSDGTEHHPMKHAARVLLGQTKNSAATADFDVVGMGPQTENLQPLGMLPVYGKTDHT